MPYLTDIEDTALGGGSTGGAPAAVDRDRGGGDLWSGLVRAAETFIPGVRQVESLVSTVGSLFSGGDIGPVTSPNVISSRSALGQDPSDFPMLSGGTLPVFSAEYATLVSTGGPMPSGMSLAIPGAYGGSIPRTLLKWLQKYAIIYGPAVAQAVWDEFQKRRRQGQTTALARASIDQAYPEIHTRVIRGRRRRMNPSNIRALRRALRRVRSFKRVTRKVKGLGLTHHGGGTHYRYRRPRRRGDLWEVEELADLEDEAEDLGVDGDFFDGDDGGE